MDELLQKRMTESGIIVIPSTLNSNYTNDIILALLKWNDTNPKKELQLYISSATNDYLNIITIYDVMQSIQNPISGYAIGLVGGCSTLLLAGCTKGKRYALKNTEIGLSELMGVLGSGVNQETEIQIAAKEVTIQKDTLESLLAKHTGQSVETIHKCCLEEKSFTAQEACEFGLIDKVLE